MTNNDRFLNKYKELENLLTNICKTTDDSPVFWYENQLTDISKQNKLRLCRIARNYLQHNQNELFFEATESMIGFLDKCCEEVLNKLNTCQNIMIKNAYKKTSWDVKDKVCDILNSLNKNKVVLIFDKNVFKGTYSADEYLQLAIKGKISKTTKIEKYKKGAFAYVSKNKLASEAYKSFEDGIEILLVTDTGKKDEKILGYIISNLKK